MKVRSKNLGFIIRNNEGYLEESLARYARKALVKVEVIKHARQRRFEGRGPYPLPAQIIAGFDLEVMVRGDNDGSVDDYCDFYLASMVKDVIIRLDVEVATYAYIARIMRWLKSEQEGKCHN